MERLKSDTKSGTIHNRSVPFPSERANGKDINGTIAFPPEHKTKLVRNLPLPCKLPVCPFRVDSSLGALLRKYKGDSVPSLNLFIYTKNHLTVSSIYNNLKSNKFVRTYTGEKFTWNIANKVIKNIFFISQSG